MDESDTRQREHSRHGLLHLVLCCSFMLIALLLLTLRTGWGTALAIVALLACPILMLLLMRHASPTGRWIASRSGDEQAHRP